MRTGLLILGLLSACASRVEPRVLAKEAARATLKEHCGTCHIASLPTALPGALAVFDLDQAEWAAKMSDAQLKNASWRLTETLHQIMPGHPRPDAGGNPLDWPNDVTPAQQEQFDRFVELELQRRARPSCLEGTSDAGPRAQASTPSVRASWAVSP